MHWRAARRLSDVDHAAFRAGGHAFLFFLKAAGEHDVGVGGRFRKEEVDDAEEFQPFESFAGEVGVRQ